MYIAYGSQTGSCESIAKRIHSDLTKMEVNCELIVLNKFKQILEKLNSDKTKTITAIIVCSTTGNGDASENAENFVRWIKRKAHKSDLLSNLNYTVLGLGDSNYCKYQFIPRTVDTHLARVGGTRIFPKGEADDACSPEDVIEPWIKNLEELLLQSNEKECENEKEEVEIKENLSEIQLFEDDHLSEMLANTKGFTAKFCKKEYLNGSESEKEILKLSFESRHIPYYEPGASISILPENSPLVINKVKNKITLASKPKLYDFAVTYPRFCNIFKTLELNHESILKYIIDLNSVPSKLCLENFLEILVKTKHPQASLIDSLLIHYEEFAKNKINLGEILEKFEKPAELTFENIYKILPVIVARNYSLVSNYNVDKDIEIVISIVNEQLKRNLSEEFKNDVKANFEENFEFQGLCSNYLKNIENDSIIWISDVPNCFFFPKFELTWSTTPLIYICNGTGITPCISYIKELNYLMEKQAKLPDFNGSLFPEMYIFTGFRSANKETNETIMEDTIYKLINSINYWMKSEKIRYLRCLSSHEDEEEEEVGIWRNMRINTTYVQDLLIENSDEVYETLFQNKGTCMICGDLEKLYNECLTNFISILGAEEKLPKEKCLSQIENIIQEKRLIIEKWL